MRYVKLIAAYDDYDSSRLGLAVKGLDLNLDGIFVDRIGHGTAHDLLDHQNGVHNIGPVWDEMQALGGLWHNRGRDGDLGDDYRGFYTPAKRVAINFEQFIDDGMPEDLWQPGVSRMSQPHDYDEDFDEIIGYVSSYFINDEFRAAAKHNLRIGFNKARRRGHNLEQHMAIVNVVKHALAHDVHTAGQEFNLGYGNNLARITYA